MANYAGCYGKNTNMDKVAVAVFVIFICLSNRVGVCRNSNICFNRISLFFKSCNWCYYKCANVANV